MSRSARRPVPRDLPEHTPGHPRGCTGPLRRNASPGCPSSSTPRPARVRRQASLRTCRSTALACPPQRNPRPAGAHVGPPAARRRNAPKSVPPGTLARTPGCGARVQWRALSRTRGSSFKHCTSPGRAGVSAPPGATAINPFRTECAQRRAPAHANAAAQTAKRHTRGGTTQATDNADVRRPGPRCHAHGSQASNTAHRPDAQARVHPVAVAIDAPGTEPDPRGSRVPLFAK